MKLTEYKFRVIFIFIGAFVGFTWTFYVSEAFIAGLIYGVIVGGQLGNIVAIILYPGPRKQTEEEIQQELDNFMTVLLSLSAAVIRSDHRVLDKEIEYVRKFFVREFGESKTGQYILQLRELLKNDLDLQRICRESKAQMSMAYRLQLLHYLFGIAYCDDNVSDNESAVIYDISTHLGISTADFYSIRSMYVQSERANYTQRQKQSIYYTILEIQPNVSNDEVKKAYREMAKKFHPDKLAHLGDDVQKAANEKFQKINKAYEAIKKERGM